MVNINRLPEKDRRRIRRSYRGHKNSYRKKERFLETKEDDGRGSPEYPT
jgi:hypothetical protein